MEIIISALVAFLVARVTAKLCLAKMERYVEDVTAELREAARELRTRQKEDRPL